MSFEDFSKMMETKLESLYEECQIPSCDCKSKSVILFEKRVKNQYDLLSEPLTKDSSGKLPEYGRMAFDHEKKRVKVKIAEDASGKNKYTNIPFNLMDFKINEGYDGLAVLVRYAILLNFKRRTQFSNHFRRSQCVALVAKF